MNSRRSDSLRKTRHGGIDLSQRRACQSQGKFVFGAQVLSSRDTTCAQGAGSSTPFSPCAHFGSEGRQRLNASLRSRFRLAGGTDVTWPSNDYARRMGQETPQARAATKTKRNHRPSGADAYRGCDACCALFCDLGAMSTVSAKWLRNNRNKKG